MDCGRQTPNGSLRRGSRYHDRRGIDLRLQLRVSTSYELDSSNTNTPSPFSQKNVQTCHCGTPSCRGVLGPRPKDRDNSQKLQESSGVLAGAKRKLSKFLSSSYPNVGRTSSVLKKKRRATITVVIPRKAMSQKRITSASTGGTLVEQESIPATKRIKGSPVPGPSPRTRGKGIVKKTPTKNKHRRHTFDALTRAVSNTKDKMSNLRNSTFLLRSSSRLTLSGDNGTEKEAEKTEKRPATSSTIRSTATTLKHNVVSTVTGPRRAAALVKYGRNGKGANADVESKSMRVITGNDE